MTRIVLPCGVLTATLALALPAQALTRTFVSSAGNDSNPCTITQPCASFAQAYSVTATNGIIAALDPGKYGPLIIQSSITINGNGWAALTAPATGSGILINGSGINVMLIGLEIDGASAAYNGIRFDSTGSLTVTDCVLKDFIKNGSDNTTGNGIFIDSAFGNDDFAIKNTTVANNGNVGIYFFPIEGGPIINGVIDHVFATNNVKH